MVMLPARVHSQRLLRVMMVAASLLMMLYVYTDIQIRSPAHYICPAVTQRNVCAADQGLLEMDTVDGVDHGVRPYVNGPPAASLFDNLRNDTRYITTFLDAGWTNDVMTIVNLIYLSILSSRVPIIPPHVAMHVGPGEPNFIFSDVFDLPRLRRAINHPAIEWKDVKSGVEVDTLGCWTVWQTQEGSDGNPRLSRLYYDLHLDISYTTVPEYTKLANRHNSFWGVAKLGFPEGREEALRGALPRASLQRHKVLLPNEQLMCFDILYYLAAHDPYEWERDYSPAWRFVGRHLHFHPKMVKLAEAYLRRAFSVESNAPIPKFISVHIRHGDFTDYCGGKPKGCWAPISVIGEHIASVGAALEAQKGITVLPQHVLVTSDESDPQWWAEIRSRGWAYIDHAKEETKDELGAWYPTFIDGILQSMGTGFVGTEGSTMSLVALRRVAEWNGGLGKMIPWGKGMYTDKL